MSNTYREIDSTLYPMMPDIHDIKKGSGYYLFSEEQMKGYLCINPRPVHADGYLLFPYALIVFDDTNRHIFSAVIEQTDYRMLSALTRTPLKELTGGHRRPTSPPELALYSSAGGHEVFQVVQEPYTEEEAVNLLLEVVLDVLDSLSDPEFVDTSHTPR